MTDRLAVLPQYLLPKRALTVLAGRFAASRNRWWTGWLIPWFIASYGVNMAEAANPDPAGYASFNDFFTRALRPDARPLAQADCVSPVDGTVIQCGPIEGDQILQAKGHRYSTRALVGGDATLAALFHSGQAVTLYLSPRDYHRIHMPCAGRLLRMIHIPGDLFSVNPATVRGVPGLFARNERVVCVFESARGPFVLTLVGATIVGSIATVWHGVVSPLRRAWCASGATTIRPSYWARATKSAASCWARRWSCCSQQTPFGSRPTGCQVVACAWARPWPVGRRIARRNEARRACGERQGKHGHAPSGRALPQVL